MTRQQVLDLYFMDARCKLIELAAFLDRVERGDGDADFRLAAFRKACDHHVVVSDALRGDYIRAGIPSTAIDTALLPMTSASDWYQTTS